MAKITQGPVRQVGNKLGAQGRAVSPEQAACIGIQRITTTGYVESAGPNPRNTQLGNANAVAAGQGPGAGRAVSKPGSQGKH